MSGIINIVDSPTGQLSTRSEGEKSVHSPAQQQQSMVAISPFASPTPWNATTGSATTATSPWRQNLDSKSSHHWSTASTASGDRSAIAAQSPPWSTTATPSAFSFISSKEAEKEAMVARAPWNQGDDSTTSLSPMRQGNGLLDAPFAGNSPAMIPPPPPVRPSTGLPYVSPSTPGKYWVEDEFGVAVHETVLWTGVKLRKPDCRPDPTRRLMIQGPSAQQLMQRKKNAASKKSPKKHSPKVQTSPSVGTPGAFSFSSGSTPGSRTLSSPNVGL